MLAELADHLEDVYHDALLQGASEDEARARTEDRLGNPDLATRELIGGDPSRFRTAVRRRSDQTEAMLRDRGGWWIPVTDLLRDLRQSLKTLGRRPGFTTVAVLTLALGIGANTAVFSVLNSVVLAPLPYEEPDQLVRLYSASREAPEERQFLSGPDILDIQDEVDGFASVGILYTYREIGRDLTTGGQPQRLRVLQVGAGYFDTYRVTPLLGRLFGRDEERADVRRVILSHSLWSAYVGRDQDIVGQTIRLDGEPYEVIGVMRPTFRDVTVGDVAAWVPEDIERARSNNRGNHYLSAVARLQPEVSVAQAQSQVDAVMTRLAREFPDTNETKITRVIPLHEDVVGGSTWTVYVLMGAAGLVLLIACLNVGNLFLVRAITQRRDSAIRAALGAARSRVVGQRLMESVLVAGFGGVIGAVVAHWGVRFLLAVSPESLARAEDVGFDTGLLAFAVALTAFTGVLFGVGPAYRASRTDPNLALHDGARGSTGGRDRGRARTALVVAQVAVAIVLLVGAGLLIRSFVAQQAVDLGFETERVATFEVHLPPVRYDNPDARVRFHHTYQDRLRAIPGVEAVGATSWLPANGHYHEWGYGYLDAAGERQWTGAMVRVIDGAYFETLGIPLRHGRPFTRDDDQDTEEVAIISQSIARRVYADQDPLGKIFRTGGRNFTVVGVVGDVAYEADGTDFGMVYLSHGQFADDRHWGLTYVLKTTSVPTAVIEPARGALSLTDEALVLYRARTMADVVSRHRAQARFTLLLMLLFAGVAVTLAAVGVYGVLAYAVTQRTQEIGVRMALGARPDQVRATVLRHGALVAGVGLACGLAGAFGLSRFLAALSFEVSAWDPTVFAVVALLMGAIVLAASYVPARRATRVDPLTALRSE